MYTIQRNIPYTILIFSFILISTTLLHLLQRERFVTNDYISVTELNKYDNTCLQLAIDKGLVDINDMSPESHRRKSILSDFEIARKQQYMLSHTINPSIDACVMTNNTMRLYNTNNGNNRIDQNTCTLHGIGVDNEVIHQQFDTIEPEEFIYPSGCMLSFDGMTKEKLNEILDDTYKVKHYPELKQQKDYEKGIVALAIENDKINAKFKAADDLNKQYSTYYTPDITNDEVVSTCTQRYTDWNDTGDWSYNYLDRHRIQCNENEVLNQYQLEKLGAKARYKYTCCKLDSKPVPRKLKNNVSTDSTPFHDSLQWNTVSLTNHTIGCPQQDLNNANMLRGIILEPQYVNQATANARFHSECIRFDTNGIPNRKMKTTCRRDKTNDTPSSSKFDILSQHNVVCKPDEALVDVGLRSTGTSIYYEYNCCKPEIVSSN